jgi:hypothetical protein
MDAYYVSSNHQDTPGTGSKILGVFYVLKEFRPLVGVVTNAL